VPYLQPLVPMRQFFEAAIESGSMRGQLPAAPATAVALDAGAPRLAIVAGPAPTAPPRSAEPPAEAVDDDPAAEFAAAARAELAQSLADEATAASSTTDVEALAARAKADGVVGEPVTVGGVTETLHAALTRRWQALHGAARVAGGAA
jgi:hypothetical protein